MAPAFWRRRISASILGGLCAASCGRIGFDLLPQDSRQAVSNDAGVGAGGAGLGGASGAPSTGGSSGSSSGGRSGGGGTTSSGGAGYGASSGGGDSGSAGSGGTTDASAPDGAGGSQSGGTGDGSSGGASSGGASSGGVSGTGGSGPDAGPSPVCASTSGTIQVWSFNSTVETWAYWPNLGPGTLSWTAATGNPTAGSLALDVASGDGVLGWIVFDSLTADLSGRTGAVWLYLDSGTVGVKLYVQSSRSTYKWADGGFVTLTPKTWTCVTIDFSAPDYANAGYDPRNIVRFGLEFAGLGPVRVYADQFAY
jgi:hypothetical protein